jgi:coenzyme F420-reducing hydrogenase alpha subunit
MTRKQQILKQLDAIIELAQENMELAEKMHTTQAEKIVYLTGLRESIAEGELYEKEVKIPQITNYDPFNFPENKEAKSGK